MAMQDDPVLRDDPLWSALERAIWAVTDDSPSVFRRPDRLNGLNSSEITRLAKAAGLSDRPVMVVRDLPERGGPVERRWLTVNHPSFHEPIEIMVVDRRYPFDIPQSKINRIIDYLRAWQEKRAEQLKEVEQSDEAGDGSDANTKTPEWDDNHRELRFHGQCCKRFRQPAENQITILRTFQDDDWPGQIDDPLPGVHGKDLKRRLRDTVRSLNVNMHLLHFECDGTGKGVIWNQAP